MASFAISLNTGLRFPKRAYGGIWNGKLLWGTLKHGRVLGVLNNPCYAGAYVFGRYRCSKSLSTDGEIQSRVQRQPIDSWAVLIQDHHAAYISWQEYLENQQILLHNQTNKPKELLGNSARAGRALLQGLLLCAGCGRRLSPRYTGNAGIYPIYECTARHQDTIYRKECVTIQADLVDQAISRRILEVLQPEQLEIALRALKELEERSEAIDRQWRMRIERLEYQAQLAQRRYEEVDPSHRLVAATLEKRWNEALEELQRLKDDYQKHRQQQGFELTSQQKAELLALAEDLPRLWQTKTTSAKDRKRMLRLLIKDVTVEKRRSERKALLHIRWQGGALEDLSVDLPLPMPERLRYCETILTQVRTLASDQDRPADRRGAQSAAIAQRDGKGIHQKHDPMDPLPLRNSGARFQETRGTYRQRAGAALFHRDRHRPLLDSTRTPCSPQAHGEGDLTGLQSLRKKKRS